MISKELGHTLITLVCCGWLFGVFFGLNYSEIRRNVAYIDTNCTILGTSVVPYRYCTKTCSYCTSYYGDRTCNGQYLLDQQLDKYDLTEATENRIEGPCNNGYRCCREHCSTCTSCSSSCRRLSSEDEEAVEETGEEAVEETGTGITNTIDHKARRLDHDDHVHDKKIVRALLSRRITPKELVAQQQRRRLKKSCHRSCHTYSCNCFCVTSTNNLECHYSCTPHYEAHVRVSFPWQSNGQPVSADDPSMTTTVVTDFTNKYTQAQQYLKEHFPPPGSSNNNVSAQVEPCHYDPAWKGSDDPNNRYHQITAQQLAFDWELGYTWWKWLLFGLPALFILVVLVMVSNATLNTVCRPTSEREVEPAMLLSLWWGVLLPLGLFLPLQAGKIDDVGKEVLHWMVFVCVGVFNGPLLYWCTIARFVGSWTRIKNEPGGLRYRGPLYIEQWRRHAYCAVLLGWTVPLAVVSPFLLSYWWLSDHATSSLLLALGVVAGAGVLFLGCLPWATRSRGTPTGRESQRRRINNNNSNNNNNNSSNSSNNNNSMVDPRAHNYPPRPSRFERFHLGEEEERPGTVPLLAASEHSREHHSGVGNSGVGISGVGNSSVGNSSVGSSGVGNSDVGNSGATEAKWHDAVAKAVTVVPSGGASNDVPSAPDVPYHSNVRSTLLRDGSYNWAVPVAVPESAMASLPASYYIQELTWADSVPVVMNLLEKLRQANICGVLSKEDRMRLIVVVRTKRDNDPKYRAEVWTEEVASKFGDLLKS
jgi:hypothetical protein